MSEDDRRHWDRRYAETGLAPLAETGPPPVFAPYEGLFPVEGRALELACGRGRAAIWLAGRGLSYRGVDVSPVAIGLARRLAQLQGLESRCSFEVHDLDAGLPDGPPVDLLLCHLFRDPRLDGSIMARLAPGGMLAVAVLSEVGAGPGRFRVPEGELRGAFGDLDIEVQGESEGMAWIVARRPSIIEPR
ncbi:MAG: class I SAM-dependent methyltransferase [Acidimicrobiia bacterium]